MRGLVRACTLAAWTASAMVAGAAPVRAQTQPPASTTRSAPTADVLFADASAKEAAVRKALAATSPQPTVLRAVRTVVAEYEGVVRHYPASGYCDDALWRGAMLARDAFEQFGESRERTAALRMLRLLQSEYPTSRFAKTTPQQVAWLDAHPARLNTPTSVAAVPATPAPAPTRSVVPANAADSPTSGPTRLVNVKAIRRAVMKDVVRVVIELDDEVAFHDERIDGPSRIFVDLQSTRSNPALIDQTLRFDSDSDVVRQIRVGRHPNAVTRVVLEASGVSSYSVYPLYSPFRLVIDCLRATPLTAALDAPPSRSAARVVAVTDPVAPPAPEPEPEPTAVAETPSQLGGSRQPPVLPAQPIRWVLKMPTLATAALPRVTPTAMSADTPTRSAAAPTTSSPPAPPATNLAGGLSIARQLGLGVSRIVIDPGHGGHDPGARGGGLTEAELVLDVAQRLERLLSRIPGVEVVLTRRGNDFVSLQERTAIANRENADLFLSIHANASTVKSARGVETYFLNFAKTQSAAAVAARENAASGQPMGALQDVVTTIALNSKVDESRDFATYVQREMTARLKRSNGALKDLGVKQAPFVVLIGAAMPSILAEISFITNPQEARLLKGAGYRQKIADALFEGVRKYQQSLGNPLAVAAQQQN